MMMMMMMRHSFITPLLHLYLWNTHSTLKLSQLQVPTWQNSSKPQACKRPWRDLLNCEMEGKKRSRKCWKTMAKSMWNPSSPPNLKRYNVILHRPPLWHGPGWDDCQDFPDFLASNIVTCLVCWWRNSTSTANAALVVNESCVFLHSSIVIYHSPT